jgi:hypothetical protein
VVTHRPLRDTSSARAGAEVARRAETLDEYRELDMLAHAWERGSLEPGASQSAPGRAEDAADEE